MFSFLNNVPPVTKNILILNVLMFIVSMMFLNKIDLVPVLGAHYVNSPFFQPYQIVTHFFMHDNRSFMHIFFNMFALVTFGSLLERLWGPKRFFIFYVASAMGAFVLYNSLGAYQLWDLKNELLSLGLTEGQLYDYVHGGTIFNVPTQAGPILTKYGNMALSPMVGASGAIFGIMAGFAYLFPNTELTLMFIPFPVKAKYLVGGYFVIELLLSFQNIKGDHVAHLAHVGGAVVGFALVYFWNRNKKTFY